MVFFICFNEGVVEAGEKGYYGNYLSLRAFPSMQPPPSCSHWLPRDCRAGPSALWASALSVAAHQPSTLCQPPRVLRCITRGRISNSAIRSWKKAAKNRSFRLISSPLFLPPSLPSFLYSILVPFFHQHRMHRVSRTPIKTDSTIIFILLAPELPVQLSSNLFYLFSVPHSPDLV